VLGRRTRATGPSTSDRSRRKRCGGIWGLVPKGPGTSLRSCERKHKRRPSRTPAWPPILHLTEMMRVRLCQLDQIAPAASRRVVPGSSVDDAYG
jgi:hypothetical protein